MSEQKPSHEVEGIVHRALRQDCVEAQIWGRVLKNVCSIEGPQEHISLKWKKFGTTKTLPRAGCPAKPEQSGEKGLGQGGDQEPNGSSVEMGEPSRRTIISAALHQSDLYGRVARLKSLLSKRHMTAHL